MTKTRKTSHDEASAIAGRLTWSAFRRDGQPLQPDKGFVPTSHAARTSATIA